MKIVYIFPNDPNPRFIKRMSLATEVGLDTFLIYWNRGINTPYTLPKDVKSTSINLNVGLRNKFKKLILLPVFIVNCINKIFRIKPDILHVGFIDMLLISMVYKLLINNNVKIIYEIGDIPKFVINKSTGVKNIIRRIMIKAEKMMCRSIDLLILTSPYFWDEYYSKFVEKNKYLYVANAPSRELFGQYEKKKDVSSKRIVIGFVGFIRYKKQITNLIDAVSKFREHFEIIISGEGPDIGEVEQYVNESRSSDFVTFTGAYNYNKEILNIYSKLDIVYSVYDTSFENVKIALPNKLYESIVCELPIIVAKNTQLERYVIKEGIGFSVNDSNPQDLIDLLSELINNREILNEKIMRCSEIKQSYYLEEYNKKLKERYQTLTI